MRQVMAGEEENLFNIDTNKAGHISQYADVTENTPTNQSLLTRPPLRG